MNNRYLIKYNTLIMQGLIGCSFFKAMFFEYDKIGTWYFVKINKIKF
jgi:hypothetical protein